MESIKEIEEFIKHQINKEITVDKAITRMVEDNKISSEDYLYKPTRMYKYFPPELYCLESLENQKNWFSKPKIFNDPFDCTFNYDTEYNNELEKSMEWKEYIPINNHHAKVMDAVNKLKERITVTCYSEMPNSLLMWSHYARNHTGFCVEYDFDTLMDFTGNGNEYTSLLLPVIYGDKKLIRIVEDTNEDINHIQIFKQLFYKSFDWIYEQEWRQVHFNKTQIESGNLCESPNIRSVILGCKSSKFLESILARMCKEKNIRLDKMEQSIHKFELTKKNILPGK